MYLTNNGLEFIIISGKIYKKTHVYTCLVSSESVLPPLLWQQAYDIEIKKY